MKKYIIVSSFLAFFACDKENKTYPDIKIGKETTSLSEVSIHRLTERKIVLSGGNEKFAVNIENSKIAQASIHQDTLKIKGLLEGQTFATIISHDKKARLDINIIPPELSLSQDSVRLYPKDESKFISINGGGDQVTITEDNPEGCVIVKWNGSNNILEIKALYEGEATVRFSSPQWQGEKILNISVQPEGVVEELGIYTTRNRSYYHELNPKMVVKRKNVGYLLSQSASPRGYSEGLFGKKIVARISPTINPKQGEYVDLTFAFSPFESSFAGIGQGTHTLYVEKITEEAIFLRGKGFKVVLPR
ncbi:hypothetical protein [Capnocytophaga sp.]|uniref:hypothetical protein n=1 Tax=Capnocytophaga sp. TaxID=44737 RepID=UPI0026DAF04B|nr:hypothetical protein [Capnocytophaga sp.]MDO5104718.1 hypothetical protein [Capnocytophaga sp.]